MWWNNFQFHTTPGVLSVHVFTFPNLAVWVPDPAASSHDWSSCAGRWRVPHCLLRCQGKVRTAMRFIFLEECCVSGLWRVMGVFTWKYACNVMSVLALDNEPVTPNSTRISVPRILQLLNVIVLVCTWINLSLQLFELNYKPWEVDWSIISQGDP